MASDTSGGTATAQPDLPTGFDENKSESMLNRIQHVLHANPILGPLAVLIVAIIAFAIVNGRFLSAANLGLVLQQVTVIATIALGQTLIILTAGIDLSAGAIAGTAGRLLMEYGRAIRQTIAGLSMTDWPDGARRAIHVSLGRLDASYAPSRFAAVGAGDALLASLREADGYDDAFDELTAR